MNYLVAVSGGIDSVVLLDMLARQKEHELTVAHFDHGIRPDSAADARFVASLAEGYGLPYVQRREELGREASEETARMRRYAFLQAEAVKREAAIVTAHHADDVVETMAINLFRGTGWRGVAVMDNEKVIRPLLSFTKRQLRRYALEHRLEWVEDSTNASGDYLRNRIRRHLPLRLLSAQIDELRELRQKQVRLKWDIDAEIASLLSQTKDPYGRSFFIQIDPRAASELLRALVVERVGHSPTRPQLERGLLAVKTARPNTSFQLGDVWLDFTTSTFSVSVKTL